MSWRVRDLFYEAGWAFGRHAHDATQISIVLRGTYVENAQGVMHRGSAADVVVKPAGTVHADTFADTRIVCIDGAFDEVELGEYGWHRADEVTAAGLRLARRFLAKADIDDDLDELLATLAPRRYVDHLLATRAAERIEAAYTRPLQLRSVAAELRVHPVYLARAFRSRWGCSPRQYLQRMRVRAAAHRLASTTESLADIALETGFSDQAHLTRVFGRLTGITPATMRRLART